VGNVKPQNDEYLARRSDSYRRAKAGKMKKYERDILPERKYKAQRNGDKL